jgi:hypothetical protein
VRSRKELCASHSLTTARRRRVSRGALLAGASLIALAAFAAPDAAQAACSGKDQTISTAVKGPILSTGGKITVNGAGVINGGPTGVNASSCSISTLSNLG